VAGPSDFPSTEGELKAFCSNPCPFRLSWCGHSCLLACHSVHDVSHTEQVVDRPCERDLDVPLTCSRLQKSVERFASVEDAVNTFKCDVDVNVHRPECPHSVLLQCYWHQDLMAGRYELGDCVQRVKSFRHPSCGHIFKNPTCARRRRWEVDPPECPVMVDHRRDCGCVVKMACHDSDKESSLESPTRCMEAVVKPRPRCTHPLSNRCQEASKLAGRAVGPAGRRSNSWGSDRNQARNRVRAVRNGAGRGRRPKIRALPRQSRI